MFYKFKFESTTYGSTNLECRIQVRIEKGSLYDSPKGALGHGASIVDTRVVSLKTSDALQLDVIPLYQASPAFKREVGRAIRREYDEIYKRYLGEKSDE